MQEKEGRKETDGSGGKDRRKGERKGMKATEGEGKERREKGRELKE